MDNYTRCLACTAMILTENIIDQCPRCHCPINLMTRKENLPIKTPPVINPVVEQKTFCRLGSGR